MASYLILLIGGASGALLGAALIAHFRMKNADKCKKRAGISHISAIFTL
jgi:hypothetical protein